MDLQRCNEVAAVAGGDAAIISIQEFGQAASHEVSNSWLQSSLIDDNAARLLIATSGDVHWASRRATVILEHSPCFRIDSGRLAGCTRRIQSKFDSMLDAAREGGRRVEDLFAPDDEESPALFVAARGFAPPHASKVMLVIRDISRESIELPDFVRLYGLTQAESHVVSMLLNGLSVAEIARRLHNSELTVRTHLKRSYSKINVRTKEQLFAKLLRLLTD